MQKHTGVIFHFIYLSHTLKVIFYSIYLLHTLKVINVYAGVVNYLYTHEVVEYVLLNKKEHQNGTQVSA